MNELQQFDQQYIDLINWVNNKNVREDIRQGFYYILGNTISNHKASVSEESYDNYMEYFNTKYPGNESLIEEAFKDFIKQHPELME